MTKKDAVRERIESQGRKIEHWQRLARIRDAREDDVTDALDEIREDLDKLRHLREDLEKRHRGFSERELRERRQELVEDLVGTLDARDQLLDRLGNVRDASEKARHHLEEHQQQQERLEKKLRLLKEHTQSQSREVGVVTFDGEPCAAWIAQEVLEPARASGVWTGTLISGYRTPEESEDICFGLCFAPTCPGICAGRSSNHSGSVKPAGAVDVGDAIGLARWCAAHGNPIFNALGAADPNHFSATGH